jgi:excisionase family DNA binding protein
MDEHPVLTVSEAASILRLSRAFTYELVARGVLPSVRFGRRIMVPRAAIQRVLEALRDEAWLAASDSCDWWSVPFDAAVEQEPEAIVLDAAEAVGDPLDLLDQ